MHVLITDLHKDAAGFGKQFAGQQQAVAQVGEVGMDAHFPGIAEGADLLWLGGQVFVLAVLNVALVYKGLKVGAVPDAIRGVDVNHLDLTSHAFLFQQRIHDQQGVSSDQAVRPVVWVLIKLDGFAERRVFYP